MSAAPQLPGVFAHLAPLLDNYGYLAVGGLIFVEDFGVPAPGETILIAAAVYAGAGRLSVVAVGVIALLAAIVGDNVGFAIGRYGGRRLVLRFGRYVWLTERRLDRAYALFNRHGGKIVAVARFIEGLRQVNGILAGISKMHWLAFTFFNAIGATLWVSCWLTLGYLAGDHLDSIYHTIARYELYVGLAAIVIVAVLIVYRVRRHRSRA